MSRGPHWNSARSFKVLPEGTTRADGIEVVTESVGPRFPQGLLVAQDDQNDGGNQNFKLVSWERVTEGMKLPPLVNTLEGAKTAVSDAQRP